MCVHLVVGHGTCVWREVHFANHRQRVAVRKTREHGRPGENIGPDGKTLLWRAKRGLRESQVLLKEPG